MKIKILIVSSIVLFALFVVNAYSIDDTEGKSADQLIDESNNIAGYSGYSPFPSTPQESRELQGKKNQADFTIPSKLSASGKSPRESRGLAETVASEVQNADMENLTQTSTPPIRSTTMATNIAGSWSFELSDKTLKELILTLFQSDGVVFGTGSMREGNNTLQVAASGSVENDGLNLDLISLGKIILYKLSLTKSGDSVYGDYEAFSPSGENWTGSAKGDLSMALD